MPGNAAQPALGGTGIRAYLVGVADSSMSNSPTRLRGKLLLADPSLRGSIFQRSVILLHEHEPEDGAMGLILNHPTGRVVGDLLKSPEFSALAKLPVHLGGPVDSNQLTFSCFWWSPKLGLRWSVRIQPATAARHMRRPGRIVRAFIGYSGWSSGQLEGELLQSSWFPADPGPALLGQAHDQGLWGELLGGISPFHRLLAATPEDPLLN